MMPVCKILKNKDEIKTYLGNVSDYVFRKYIRMGMPARYDEGNWMAHVDNIDEFFRIFTYRNSSSDADKSEQNGGNGIGS